MAIVTSDTNLNSLSYTAGETITIQGGATLTMDSDPTVRPGIIQCTRSGKFEIINTSTTTPIVLELNSYLSDLVFTGNGVLEVRGEMMEIWTSDGTYKSWDFTTLYSGKLTDVTLAEVETSAGSGEYKPWRITEITPSMYEPNRDYYSIGSGNKNLYDASQEVLFWDSDTKTLDTGDGTNGKLIPAGCKVRIPNILITNQYHYSDQAYRHTITSGGAPTGGTFTITITDKRTGTVIGTTTPLAYNASLASVDAALEAVLGTAITTSGGPLPTAIVITQAGAWATIPLAFSSTSSVTGGTNPLVAVYGYNAPDLSLLNLNPSGTLDAECVAFSRKFYVVCSAFSKFRAIHAGFGTPGYFGLLNSNGTVELDHVSHSVNPYYISAVSQITNVASTVSVNKLVTNTKISTSLYFGTLPNVTKIDDCEAHSFGYRTGTSQYGFYLFQLSDLVVNNPVSTCGRFFITNCNDLKLLNPKESDHSGAAQLTTVSGTAAMTFNNSKNIVVFNFQKIGTAACRTVVFGNDAACDNIQIIDGSYDCSNNGTGLTIPAGTALTFSNFNVTNIRTGPIIDMPAAFTSTDTNTYNVRVTSSTGTDPLLEAGQNNYYDLMGCTALGFSPVHAGVENFVGGNFTELSETPTTGNVIFGAFGRGSSLVQNGGAYTDQIGSIYLPSDGDTAIATMPFTMHGITSFQNATPLFIGETLGGTARIWRIINDGGVTGGTFTISVYDSTNTLIGTTTPLAYNATVTVIDQALGVVTGSAGNHTVSGDITAGFVITFLTTYQSGALILTVNGSGLTGGTKPGTADAYAQQSRLSTDVLGPGLTVEYEVKNPSDSWAGTWSTVNGTNLSSALSSLTGYDAGVGLDMRMKFTAIGNDDYRRIQFVGMATNVDTTLWSPADSTITLNGPGPTDTVKVFDIEGDSELYELHGGGLKELTTGANYGKQVYFTRVSSTGKTLMTTYPLTVTLTYGNNGSVNLYYGDEVQLANSSDVSEIKSVVNGINTDMLTVDDIMNDPRALTVNRFGALR